MRPPRLRALSLLISILFLPTTFSTFQPTVDLFQNIYRMQPQHCTKTPVVIAMPSTNINSAIERGMQMQFHIGLHTTVCFRLDEPGGPNTTHRSYLHTIRLDRLEHHHPVSQKYQFAIPEVRYDCFCECDANSDRCSSETHQFNTCPSGDNRLASCYRTFFPNQSPAGCPSKSSPKLCCDVKFTPFRNQTFTAVKVEQPSTFAHFVYTAYDYVKGRWQEMDRSVIKTQLDGGNQERFLDNRAKISLSVSAGGRASHQLETGMYFANSNPGGEMGELRRQPLNEVADNNFDWLGWYRRDDATGQFYVNNGIVRMEKVHSAKVKNCKDQKYMSTLDAKNYVTIDPISDKPGSFNLTRPLEQEHPWIQSARIYDGTTRQVIVTHAEGTNLHVTLQATGNRDGRNMIFYHNGSQIDDFAGTVIVDAHSNRYFNVTVFGASGKIKGVVLYSTRRDSAEIYGFTTYVDDLTPANRSLMVPLPAYVESGSRLFCLRADEESEEHEICRIVDYYEKPLEVDLENSRWREETGICPECNKLNYNDFTRFLNPMSWVNAISDLGSFVSTATSVLVYLCVLIVLYILLTKIIIPIFKCWICPMYVFKSSSKKKSKRKSEKEEKSEKKRRRDDSDEEGYV